ncbi:MAG: hypothetical protein K9I74_09290, partial [Bacteroidales bacterium]|nr:hypothetical protein [Bacteroidales bacterium]
MRKSLFFSLLLAMVFGISTSYAQRDVQNAQSKSDSWLEERSDAWGVSKAQIQERLEQEEQTATKPQEEEHNRNGSSEGRNAEYFEDFSGDFPPEGWVIGGSGDAPVQEFSSEAGGESPEVEFYWLDVDDGDYIESEAGTLPELDVLEFKSHIDSYSGNFTCKVMVNGDDVTPWSNPVMGDMPAETYQIDISGYSNPTVHFEFNGTAWNINDWQIDDVAVMESAPVFAMTPESYDFPEVGMLDGDIMSPAENGEFTITNEGLED